MARKKKKSRKSKSRIGLISTGVAATQGLIVPLFGDGGAISGAINAAKTHGIANGIQEFIDILGINFIGYKFSDGSWWGWEKPAATYGGMLLGYGAGKIATKTGVNRSLAKIPFIGEYIKIG